MNPVSPDPNLRARILLAFALAVALHALAVSFVPRTEPHPEEPERVIAERVTLTHATPTPTPTPPPPPPTPPPTPRPAPAVGPTNRPHGGKAAPLHAAPHTKPFTFKPLPATPATPGTGIGFAGAGEGTGGGPGVGSGGDNGVGDGDNAPCGFVEFKPLRRAPYHGKRRVWVEITIHLRNGENVVDNLGWPFVYAGDADDPWSRRNINNPEFVTVMQLPPPGYDLAAKQLPATVLAVRETGPDGYTTLAPCPEPTDTVR